ncbi:MAG: NADH-quinone oxidoreductase subunit NuoB, partial [Candidatus Methanoperedens sp.]|nr:NADH-quinone oxidoreductase subunit NuoB [Candidatus Methanoperedens sp.]
MDPITIDTTKIKTAKKKPVTALEKLEDTGLISTVLAAREREGFILFSTIDQIFNWARLSSLWPVTSGLACCAIEMMAVAMAHHDIARFGMEIFRASPRQADLMFVSGTVTKRMAPRIKQLYEMMPEPKWVIAVGSCASTGG